MSYGKRHAWCYVWLFLAFRAFGQEDLTGVPGVSTDTRVMVIFDNSRSMQYSPDGTSQGMGLYSNDLDPKTLVNGICDPASPPANCGNKWCLGKCVMHNLLDPYEGIMEVGFATYYNYYKRETAKFEGQVPNTYCHYDILAGPSEKVGVHQLLQPQSMMSHNLVWSTDSRLDEAGRCTITNDTTEAFRSSNYDAARHCSPTQGATEPPKTCFAVDSSGWFERSENQVKRYSPKVPGLVLPLSPMWKNGLRNPGSPESFSSVIFPSSFPGTMSGVRYYLYSQNTQGPFLKEQKFECPALGSKFEFVDTFPGCSPQNPCDMTLSSHSQDYKVKATFYSYQGEAFGDWTFINNHRSDTVALPVKAGDECPSSLTYTNGRGCTTSNPCELTNGTRREYSQTKYYTLWRDSRDEYTKDGLVYSATGRTKEQYTGSEVFSNADDPSVCVNPPDGRAKASVDPGGILHAYEEEAIDGQTCLAAPSGYTLTVKEGTCRYEKRRSPSVTCYYYKTFYELRARETTLSYSCEYNRTHYLYGRDYTHFCYFKRDEYTWRPRTYAYRWETIGGEVIGSFAHEVAQGRDLCNEYSPELQDKCPDITQSPLYHPACSLPGRSCRLRWRGADGQVAKGRLANSRADDGLPKYCRSADEGGLPFTSVPRDSMPDWCEAKLSPGVGEVVDQFLMSDPYSPTINSHNPTPFSTQAAPAATLGGKLLRVEYSTDGTKWTDSPPTPSKVLGWSRTPNTQGGQPATAFLPFHRDNLTAFRRFMEMPSLQNPTGLQMPSRPRLHRERPVVVPVTGYNTPILGTLVNVKDYLKEEVLPNDPVAMCRNYAVVLVTDGNEYRDQRQAQYPTQDGFDEWTKQHLVQAVSDLRDVSAGQRRPLGGVKTFVVGFGDEFRNRQEEIVKRTDILDAMAKAAGTDVDGKAFVAMSAVELSNRLRLIFDTVAQNTYSRNKPVISITRDKMYVGAFRITGDGYEWDGFLNSYAIDGRKIEPKPRFEFHKQLNGQAASSRRIFTFVKQTQVNLVQGLSGTIETALYDAMGVTPAVGTEVLKFIKNADLKAPFVGSPRARKDSRLSDIYHSTPVLVGPPMFPTAWAGPETAQMAAYEAFKQKHLNRPERVYVGSNTGMVHAICENSDSKSTPDCGPAKGDVGSEVFAFIPPSVLSKLDSTRRGRKAENFTVDGSFGVADVCLAQDCSKPEGWQTVLLGSRHKGGNGIFALDITLANQPRFLWEMEDAALGDTWSPPTVVKTRVNKGERWVGLLGGGFRSPKDYPGPVSNSVLVVDVATGKVVEDRTQNPAKRAVFRVDSNPHTCDTQPETCILPRNSVPGRLAVSLNRSGAAFVSKAYFGDTQGRMWTMGFAHENISTWAPKVLFDPTRKDCSRDALGNPVPIVDALNSNHIVGSLPFQQTDSARPLFQRLMSARNSRGEAWVFGGTGDVNDPNWLGTGNADSDFDHFYGVRATSHQGGCVGTPVFVKRFAIGEKVLSEGTVASGVVFVPTYRPPTRVSLQNAATCSIRGDARIYAYIQSSGQPAPVFSANLGAKHTASVIDLPNEGRISDLVWVSDPSNARRGTLVYATDEGTPKAIAVEGLPREVPVWSWRRVH